MADHPLGRAAAQGIEDATMTGSGHTYEVDVELDGNVHNRSDDIAVSKHN
jgi:hypothetical protein